MLDTPVFVCLKYEKRWLLTAGSGWDSFKLSMGLDSMDECKVRKTLSLGYPKDCGREFLKFLVKTKGYSKDRAFC